MRPKTVLFAALLCFCGNSSFALSDESDRRLSFRYISVNDGLSQNSVTSILQNKDGIVMISTYDGMNFFDGYGIVSQRYSPSRPEGLFNNRIVCMESYYDGTVWVGLDGGLMRYDSDLQRYINYTDSLGMLSFYSVRSLDSDGQGNLWVGTSEELIFGRKDGRGNLSFSVVEGMPAANVYAIQCDRQGGTWAGTIDGLYFFPPAGEGMPTPFPVDHFAGRTITTIYCDRQGGIWVGYRGGLAVRPPHRAAFVEVELPPGPSVQVDRIVQDFEGRMWFGTNRHGLFCAVVKDYEIRSISGYTPSDFFGRLTDEKIAALYIDPSNVLWVGTRRGVNYADLSTPQFHLFRPLVTERLSELGYAGEHIYSLFSDSRDQLWINKFEGDLLRYDLTRKRMTDMTKELSLSGVSQMIESRDGTLWAAAHDAVYRIEGRGGDRYASRRVDLGSGNAQQKYRYYSGLSEDPHGHIWIATLNGLVRYRPADGSHETYLRSDGLSSNSSYCVLADPDGHTLWVGSSDLGLTRVRYDDRGIVSTEIIRQKGNGFRISHNQVWCLYRDEEGILWVGTDAGLNRIETRDGEIVSVSHVTDPLLREAKIQAIIGDSEGCLWLNSSQGLYSYDPRSHIARRYISDNGLQSNTFTNAVTKTRSGWILAGGINGINYFNPRLFPKRSYAGRPVLTRLRVFNKTIRPGQKYDGREILSRGINVTDRVTLHYEHNNFVLEFTSDHYAIPRSNRFRYKLEHYDRDWIEVGASQRFASYENLPAGRYTFLLQSANSDRQWSREVKRVEFVILPPPWASWWAVLLYLTGGALLITGVIFYFRSRQRWRQELFRREIEQQNREELNEMKLNFFMNITHELRTPLTLISAPLRDLRARYDSEEYAGFRLGIIDRNVRKLLKLINQLLDIRRISSHTLPMAVSLYDVYGAVRGVVDSFAYLSSQSGIALRFVAPEERPEGWFDLDKIEKVLHNLISNAFKFTPRGGGIEVGLRFETGDSGKFAVVSVRDSGVGIPQRELSRIFDMFYHGTPLHGQSSGVGLSLTKALIELHGGRVEVSSAPQQGSEFTVRFRIDREAYKPEYIVGGELSGREREGVPSAVPAEKPHQTYTVLVVEDNADMLDYITECLKGEFTIVRASDGEQGLEAARTRHPDIVITDMMMPVMDGLEFIRRMKADSRTGHIPIIVHSVKNDRESIREAFVAGAYEYIVKPFEPETLVFRMTNLLNARTQFARKVQNEKNMEPSGVHVPSQDEELLVRIRTVVEENMSNVDFGVDQMASELGMSRTQLYRRTKAIPPGRNPNEIIRDIRIRRAAQLLATGQLRVAEVLYEIGMTNHTRFIRYFRDAYGITPKEYIRKFNSRPDDLPE